MVTPALKQLFVQRGIQLIPIETGTQILINSLQSNGPVQTVVGGALAPPEMGQTPSTYRIRRKLTLAANPFLQDHVVGGVAVLPTVCAISWIGRTCEQRYPGFKFAQCQNFKVLKGIVFNQTCSEEYVVDIKKVEQHQTDNIVLDVIISSETQTGKMRYHYTAQIVLKSQLSDAPLYAFAAPVVSQSPSGIPYYQDGTLFHGPRLQGVSNVLELHPDKLTMVCKAPMIDERDQGQFPVHTFNPFAADVQFQSMVIWARYMYGAASLPLACKFGEQFKRVPFDQTFYVSMTVESTTESSLTASIVTHDEHGHVYNHISGAEVTISKSLNSLFLQNQPLAQVI
ncbi:MAG: hypothetical protein HOH77_10845 [Candidatus Latescibacteria bacterium]|nr:hypothetical protein [Candidatus Latescibacterota bacterium]